MAMSAMRLVRGGGRSITASVWRRTLSTSSSSHPPLPPLPPLSSSSILPGLSPSTTLSLDSSKPPASFDSVLGKFLQQTTIGPDSHALSNQLVFFDLCTVDSNKLAQVLAQLAKLKQRDLALCEKIAFELQSRADGGSSSEGDVLQSVAASLDQLGCLQITLSRLVTSLETMSLLGAPFDFAQCRRLCQDLRKRTDLPPAAAVSIITSLAQINYFDRELCDHVCESMSNLCDLTVHDIHTLILAFARFDYKHRAWLEAATSELTLRDLSQLSTQDVCLLLNAFARLRFRKRMLSRHIIDDLVVRDMSSSASVFSTQQLVSVLVSFAATKQKSRRLCDRVARELVRRHRGEDTAEEGLSSLEFATFASLINALATVGVNDAALFRVFCDEVLARDLTLVEDDDQVLIVLKSLQVLVGVDLYESLDGRGGNNDDNLNDDDDEDDNP